MLVVGAAVVVVGSVVVVVLVDEAAVAGSAVGDGARGSTRRRAKQTERARRRTEISITGRVYGPIRRIRPGSRQAQQPPARSISHVMRAAPSRTRRAGGAGSASPTENPGQRGRLGATRRQGRRCPGLRAAAAAWP